MASVRTLVQGLGVGAGLGAGFGAGLMFVFDPANGRRRRALARDKIAHWSRSGGAFFAGSLRDLEQRASGRLHDARARWFGGPVADDILVERVRAQLGRLVLHSHEVQVFADNGRVTLRGKVRPAERTGLVAAVRLVPGVHEVGDALELGHFDEAGRLRRSMLRRPWKPATKLMAGTAGGLGLAALAVFGLRS